MDSEYAIETKHLKKQYGEKLAVSDLTLQVPYGEVFGFLGPNGAGKTTSVKMLLGLVAPTAGDGRILGQPFANAETRRKVGFLPEQFSFHGWLTGTEFLQLHGDLFGLPKKFVLDKIPELLRLVGLEHHAGKKLRQYSKGMLQRIGLAQALINEPQLVILDEPTSGLDPLGRRLVRDVIRILKETGTTVFINSHLLSEIEVTCDRVAFIKSGKIVHVASIEKQRDNKITLEIKMRKPGNVSLAWLSKYGELMQEETRNEYTWVKISLAQELDIAEINRGLVSSGIEVFSLNHRIFSLEELFVRIMGGDGGVVD